MDNFPLACPLCGKHELLFPAMNRFDGYVCGACWFVLFCGRTADIDDLLGTSLEPEDNQ